MSRTASSGSAERVVAVVAHPDDAELLCYGTLRKAREAGAEVSVVVVTHGANGVSVADADAGRQLAEDEREKEVTAAWHDTGIDVVFLHLTDGALVADLHLISLVEAELNRLQCTLLITHSPRAANDHQDHLAVAVAAANAATRVPTCHTVLHGEPHAPRSGFSPTVLVDVTDVVDDKVRALNAHHSQDGRWYLSSEYTRHRAAQAGWSLRPAATSTGRSFEAFETTLLTLTFAPSREDARP
ncbi:PIG-L family deacetylase [Streptomyces ipomoeae]|uniref:PIG-L deacetylase family protein n=1 Tax=Streptomyces ipomoeae TaxID=103232 RepID=UPI0029B4C926|nr:PIG-L family deacetylase [Streptomyces ipomoeae]MDX2824894.1 PIG-L family deacetylase [Streptomyces ipomoeae]MDX2877491.1 PIG-L family deacetylase [Streptomyces ipomoeae]